VQLGSNLHGIEKLSLTPLVPEIVRNMYQVLQQETVCVKISTRHTLGTAATEGDFLHHFSGKVHGDWQKVQLCSQNECINSRIQLNRAHLVPGGSCYCRWPWAREESLGMRPTFLFLPISGTAPCIRSSCKLFMAQIPGTRVCHPCTHTLDHH
jgi:hypothetical protein